MPYPTIDELPPAVRHLPVHAQEIFRAAFNTAWYSYGDEETAFRVAWAAVNKRYRKRGEFWVEKYVELSSRRKPGPTGRRPELLLGGSRRSPGLRDLWSLRLLDQREQLHAEAIAQEIVHLAAQVFGQ